MCCTLKGNYHHTPGSHQASLRSIEHCKELSKPGDPVRFTVKQGKGGAEERGQEEQYFHVCKCKDTDSNGKALLDSNAKALLDSNGAQNRRKA